MLEVTQKQWFEFLRHITLQTESSVSPSTVRSLLLDCDLARQGMSQLRAFELLNDLSSRLGWHPRRLVYTVEEVRSLPAHYFPLYTFSEISGFLWLCVHKKENGEFSVQTFHGDDSPPAKNMSFQELAAALQKEALTQPFSWVMFEPAEPLEALTSHQEVSTPPLNPLSRFKALLWSEKTDLLAIVGYSTVIGFLTLTTPIVVQALVNTVAFGTLLQPLFVLSMLLAAGLSFSAVLQVFRSVLVELLARRVFVKVSLDFAYRLPRVSYAQFQERGGAELVNRFFDVVNVQKTLSVLLFEGLTASFQILIGLLLLALYHPVLLALDLLLIVGLLFVMRVLGRGATESSKKESKHKYRVAAWLEEIAKNPLTFKAFGAPAFAVEHADHLAQEYLRSRQTHFSILLRQIVGFLSLQVLASVSVLLVGGWLVIQRQLSLGQLVAAELVLATMLLSISKLGKIFENYYDLLASLDKLGQVLDLPLESKKGERLLHQKKGIRLAVRALSYQFEEEPRPMLEDLSFSLAPGEKVALRGHAGAGKSTLIELLFGLRESTAGVIQMDDYELRELDLESLRREVVAIHHIEIVEGTILENLMMGRPHLSRRDARESLRKVGLLEDILRLPLKLETPLRSHGTQLSKTQRALLVLARAIMDAPRLLLIDALFDELPEEEKTKFGALLTSSEETWTLLLVTEDPHWWKACDRVLTLAQGSVDESRPSAEINLEETP